jgi:hypothetical protein
MGREKWFILMERNMLEIGKIINKMEKVLLLLQMGG